VSDADAIVDWALAERVASTLIAGLPAMPGSVEPPAAAYRPGEVEAACERAIGAAAAYAGLGEVASPPRPELVERREWVGNALASLSEAARPVEARVAAELDLPGPLGGLARRGVGAAIGVEAGLAAGYAAKRVLGQYDVALLGPGRPPRLLFVGENLEASRRALDADRDLFLDWVALHESTHVIQFERVGWLAPHLRALATELIEGAAEGLDAAALGRFWRRLARDPRAFVRAALRGELARMLADPGRRETLDRLQAAMSVVEGHAEHVMDACAASLGTDLTELRRRLEARRMRRGGLSDLLARLLGMDLKLRQYRLGKAFCDRVAAEAGPDAVRLVWRSADALPSLAELEGPLEWLERAGAVVAR
jgi:coenzyme F420 biosynthesis associated uncharacterized protein